MHRKMALALVQSPVDLSHAAHAHLQHHPLAVSPSSPARRSQQLDRHLFPHREEMTSYHCNGFVKIPCSCSSLGGGAGVANNITTDEDESDIPTPPPAAHFSHHHQLQQRRECPVHPSYVTVHNPASGPSLSARYPPTSRHLKQRDGNIMPPDITAFSRMRHQMSTDSDNSNYKTVTAVASLSNNKRLASQDSLATRVQCYQCHGAGHVTVPSLIPYARSLPRDLTSSTVMMDLIDSPAENEPTAIYHQHHFHIEQADTNYCHQSRQMLATNHHQRRHSIGPENEPNYGSLRRITAV